MNSSERVISYYVMSSERLIKSSEHLKQGIQEFHRKYVLVPADKAACCLSVTLH